jgi:hypothetical protein
MRIVLLNLLAIFVVAAHIVAIEVLRARSKWIEENHGWMQMVAWLVTLFLVYLLLSPILGLEPNRLDVGIIAAWYVTKPGAAPQIGSSW